MLELKKIKKVYELDTFKQTALNEISISFRKCEFVSILGQSGSGKTTLLNIIGGLDSYTSGDLIVNGVSTKKYTDRDWDIYRNNRIGFIFQSYNLIGHQTILANVELALTLSGVSKKERRERAINALKEVGLINHINKKPNQLSGGQMQRVAIARALINNPEIILADEPTGALDSETSVQIMNLLKEIAKDCLVIMVTHNPDLAHEYSTRIVELLDGNIISDSNPYIENEMVTEVQVKKKRLGKTSMSHKTAFGLSLNNLLTKKGRTILTAFAGSIGIIGIAVILSISTGVQRFIDKTEEETLSSYPLTIEETTLDLSSFMGNNGNDKTICEDNTICSNNIMGELLSATTSSQISNNLEDFKKYLDNSTEMKNLTNDIKYYYGFDLQIYSTNNDKITKVNPNMLASAMMGNTNTEMSTMMNSSNNVFKELMDNQRLLEGQYDIVKGRFPEKYNEIVLIVNEENQLTDFVMYALGLKDQQEITNIQQSILSGKEYENKVTSYTYDEILNLKYKLVLNNNLYQKEGKIWVNKSTDPVYLKNILDNAIELEVVGIIKPSENATVSTQEVFGYLSSLVKYVMKENEKSSIVQEQRKNSNVNVLTNQPFDGIMATYENNLRLFGVANEEKPSLIEIYPKSFEDKDKIKNLIEEYNNDVKEKDKDNNGITYTDYVGLLMSVVTSIVNVITIVLVGFVAVSLIVSSIMIAIITYISVLERTKEIGILRAIGASKKDISRVFNAETFIEGLIAGVMGIIVTLLINWPINVIVGNLSGVKGIATLNPIAAIILILISIFLTVIAGLIPSRMASKKDPVESLRTE